MGKYKFKLIDDYISNQIYYFKVMDYSDENKYRFNYIAVNEFPAMMIMAHLLSKPEGEFNVGLIELFKGELSRENNSANNIILLDGRLNSRRTTHSKIGLGVQWYREEVVSNKIITATSNEMIGHLNELEWVGDLEERLGNVFSGLEFKLQSRFGGGLEDLAVNNETSTRYAVGFNIFEVTRYNSLMSTVIGSQGTNKDNEYKSKYVPISMGYRDNVWEGEITYSQNVLNPRELKVGKLNSFGIIRVDEFEVFTDKVHGVGMAEFNSSKLLNVVNMDNLNEVVVSQKYQYVREQGNDEIEITNIQAGILGNERYSYRPNQWLVGKETLRKGIRSNVTTTIRGDNKAHNEIRIKSMKGSNRDVTVIDNSQIISPRLEIVTNIEFIEGYQLVDTVTTEVHTGFIVSGGGLDPTDRVIVSRHKVGQKENDTHTLSIVETTDEVFRNTNTIFVCEGIKDFTNIALIERFKGMDKEGDSVDEVIFKQKAYLDSIEKVQIISGIQSIRDFTRNIHIISTTGIDKFKNVEVFFETEGSIGEKSTEIMVTAPIDKEKEVNLVITPQFDREFEVEGEVLGIILTNEDRFNGISLFPIHDFFKENDGVVVYSDEIGRDVDRYIYESRVSLGDKDYLQKTLQINIELVDKYDGQESVEIHWDEYSTGGVEYMGEVHDLEEARKPRKRLLKSFIMDASRDRFELIIQWDEVGIRISDNELGKSFINRSIREIYKELDKGDIEIPIREVEKEINIDARLQGGNIEYFKELDIKVEFEGLREYASQIAKSFEVSADKYHEVDVLGSVEFDKYMDTITLENLPSQGLIYKYDGIVNEGTDVEDWEQGWSIPEDYDPKDPFNPYYPWVEENNPLDYVQDKEWESENNNPEEPPNEGNMYVDKERGEVNIGGNTNVFTHIDNEDYKIKFDVELGMGHDCKAGYIFKYKDDKNYYKLMLSSGHRPFSLIQIIDGEERIVAYPIENYFLDPGSTHTVEVQVAGDRLIIYTDGRLQYDLVTEG